MTNTIREEADLILYTRDLHALLSNFGLVYPHGSYALDVMTWRDLDIYVVNDRITPQEFFDLGKSLVQLLKPIKMSYRNEILNRAKELPKGLYWGMYLGETDGGWKIDVWAVSEAEYSRLNGYQTLLESRLNDENRKIIMNLKSQCWHHPKYRKEFYSTDIYEAVLDNHITNFASFKEYLKREKGIDI